MTALSTSASILVESQRSQAGHRAEAIMTTVRVYSTRGEAGCVWVADGAAICSVLHTAAREIPKVLRPPGDS
jgi:1,2-phenylacetyl-CoA epoxidase PaaB subunit